MHQQAWIMRKHHDQLQVRQGDQPWYPIQDRSFVAHGGSRMPCAPACKLGTVTKNWTCDKSPSEQGLPPHTKAVCRENISSVAFSNGDLEKTGPANSKVISWRKSEKRIRKALQKWANIEARNVMTKLQVHEDIGGKTDSSNIYLRWLSAWSTSGLEKPFLYIEDAQLRQATGNQTGRIRVFSN